MKWAPPSIYPLSQLAEFKAHFGEKGARLLALDPQCATAGLCPATRWSGKLIDSVTKTGENEMVHVRLKDGFTASAHYCYRNGAGNNMNTKIDISK
jgi:hypothetical protein